MMFGPSLLVESPDLDSIISYVCHSVYASSKLTDTVLFITWYMHSAVQCSAVQCQAWGGTSVKLSVTEKYGKLYN